MTNDRHNGALFNFIGSQLERYPYTIAAYLLNPAVGAGYEIATKAHGYFGDTDNVGKGATSLIPGFGVSRYLRQRRGLSKRLAGGSGRAVALSENIGWATSILAAAGIGSVIGAITTGGGSPLAGAIAGAGLGATAASLATPLGHITALATPSRTEEEQRDYENSPARMLLNYILPGFSSYNTYKTLGYLMNEEDPDSGKGEKAGKAGV